MRATPLLLALAALPALACRESPPRPAADTASAAPVAATLTGAGATFPYPVYARWFNRWATQTGTYINYQSIGSGGGIAQLAAGTVDFGASDSPAPHPELERDGRTVQWVPMIVGAVAVTWNLPTVQERLRLDGATLADIYRGRIARWDDARIVALNPGVPLPPTPVVVVHRADGSGTTRAFTRYLADASEAWRRGPGTGETVRWPAGIGARGNEGVAAQVKQTPGAVGYVQLTYAVQSRLPVASLRNPAGAFVSPGVQAMSAAARAVTDTLPPGSDYRVSLVNAPAPDAYPLASFSWILVRRPAADTARIAALERFIAWALREGAPDARELGYAPLPDAVRERVLASLPKSPTAPLPPP